MIGCIMSPVKNIKVTNRKSLVEEELMCNATLNNNLFIMNTSKEMSHLTSNDGNFSNANLQHLRMNYLNFSDIKKVPGCAKDVTLTQDKSNIMTCTHCLKGKKGRFSFKNDGSRTTRTTRTYTFRLV